MTDTRADYSLLSDCHSVALVSKAGSIDWLCGPNAGGHELGKEADFPQAFSHIGLINAAWAISQAERRS